MMAEIDQRFRFWAIPAILSAPSFIIGVWRENTPAETRGWRVFATTSASIDSVAALPAIVCQETAETRACVWCPSSLLRPGKTKDHIMSSLGRAPRSAHQITLPPDAAKTSPFDTKKKKKKPDAETKIQPAAKRSSTRSGSGSAESQETVIWAGKPRSLAADTTALSEEAFHCCSSSISC